jgi:hypothetical protein
VLEHAPLAAHCRYRSKCDRQVPCISCSKRGDAASCSYSNGGRNRRDRSDGGSRASEAQIRLQKLEEMVTSLMQTTKEDSENCSGKRSSQNVTVNQRSRELSNHSSPENAETRLEGHLDVRGSETNYLDATHWVTLLQNVCVSSCRKASDTQLTFSRFKIFKASLNLTLMIMRKHYHPHFRMVLILY